MGHKIFLSYKYADDSVQNLSPFENSTVRDYVNKFEEKLEITDDIQKFEEDGTDLSKLNDDDKIWEKLKDRIYDSTITIVFISPNMKEEGKRERDQWIPWEISYSLKELSRKDKNGNPVTSHTNALLAVVLPDINGKYDYYLEEHNCCYDTCVTHHTSKLFYIMRKNKFNLKNKKDNMRECPNKSDYNVWTAKEPSYMKAVKWHDFINDFERCIDDAYKIQALQENAESYELQKEIE